MHDYLEHYDNVSKALYFTDAAMDAMIDVHTQCLQPHMKDQLLEEAYEHLHKTLELLNVVKDRQEHTISGAIDFLEENAQ